MGTVVEAGGGVRSVRPGDRVLVSCISARGRCRFCRESRYGQCRGGGGWILGHTVDGTQAEYVRVPFADLSVHPLPDSVDSVDAVLLADIFPTSYEVGVLNGAVRPADTVVVVGTGPIGLAAIVTAGLYSPGRIVVVDLAESRLSAARALGVDATANGGEGPEQLVADLTDGLGADVVMEAVGVPEAFEMCTRTPMLLRMMAAGRLPSAELITHRFELGEMEEAYDVFVRASETAAVEVALCGPQHTVLSLPDTSVA